ncbi:MULTISPECIES: hypothetical protein [Actinomycetes]|uniref:Conjugal transfer protein TrbL n=1 Tax=Streptomyces noursei TaxID=1971 RepID=A0A2N8P461_STRNR|nr:hypothetical protein [Streptomyces noursei]PNE35771.1 hypothetical protein AOB60_43055 [Streptomyces noursei]
MPDPTPPADPSCTGLPGAAYDICVGRTQPGGGGGAGAADNPLDAMDPLTSLAKATGHAAAWMVRHLGEFLTSPHQIDLANASFIQQYAVVFAGSSLLVLVLWLKAITKRAVNGARLVDAMRDAIGLLWLAVGVTAFAPALLYITIEAVSAVTQALAGGLGSHGDLFASWARDLESGAGGGGPLIWLLKGLATLLLCGALYLLVILRRLAIYVGAILGILVYSGLVDRDWWSKVRKWSGCLVAIIGIEPVIVIVLGLAAALQGDASRGSVTTGLAITGIALGASVMLITKVPGMGESFRIARVQGRMAGRVAGGAVGAMTASAGTGAAAGVMRGISTHGDRSSGNNSSSSSRSNASNGPQGGMSAHSQRKPRPPRPKDPGAGS